MTDRIERAAIVAALQAAREPITGAPGDMVFDLAVRKCIEVVRSLPSSPAAGVGTDVEAMELIEASIDSYGGDRAYLGQGGHTSQVCIDSRAALVAAINAALRRT